MVQKATLYEAIVLSILFGIILGSFITLFSSYERYDECQKANAEYVKLMEN